jgi:hypothetical protein
MGTNRVSLAVGTVAFDDRKIASRRKMKISDSIGGAPWFGARGEIARRSGGGGYSRREYVR